MPRLNKKSAPAPSEVPAGGTPATPTVATVTVESAKVAFVAGLNSTVSARDTLTAAFRMAVSTVIGAKSDLASREKLRKTLVEWGTEAGIAKKTVTNNVSRLMRDANLAIRKRESGGTKATVAMVEFVGELLDWIDERLEDGDDVVAIIKLALEQARKAKEEEIVPVPVAAAKAA